MSHQCTVLRAENGEQLADRFSVSLARTIKGTQHEVDVFILLDENLEQLLNVERLHSAQRTAPGGLSLSAAPTEVGTAA